MIIIIIIRGMLGKNFSFLNESKSIPFVHLVSQSVSQPASHPVKLINNNPDLHKLDDEENQKTRQWKKNNNSNSNINKTRSRIDCYIESVCVFCFIQSKQNKTKTSVGFKRLSSIIINDVSK